MKLICSTALACMLFGTSVIADSESHTQAAYKLLEVTNSQTLADGMVTEMKSMLSNLPIDDSLSVEQEKLFLDFQTEMQLLIESKLSWTQLKPEYATVYTSTYSEDELNQLITFYQSALGQKVLANAGSISTSLDEVPQKHINKLISEMQTAAQAVMQKINLLKQTITNEEGTNNL